MTIHRFNSSMQGAPVYNGVAGAAIALLDACLLNGFNSLTTTLSGSGSLVTAGTASPHGYTSGDVVQVLGAVESGFNGKFAITVTGASAFTYGSTGSGSATGTITSKRAPPDGWEKQHTGTNLAAYRSTFSGSNQRVLQIKDTTTTYASARGYEAMSDVNTGTGAFPTTTQIAEGSYAMRKSSTADATARVWAMWADEKRFYFACAWHASYLTQFGIYFFGDFPSFKAGDGYNILINFDNSNAGANIGVNNLFVNLSSGLTITQANKFVARPYNQAGPNSILAGFLGDYAVATYIGAAGMSYPAPVDNGLYVSPVAILESSNIRGMMPGLYQPLHNTPLAHMAEVTDIVGLSGRTLQAITTAWTTTTCQVLLDVTGPWG